MGRPSVRRLAAAIGVSPATVSRVLNEQPGVSEETRAWVLRAIRDIGYPSPWLSGRRAPLVGIIVPEPDNPIFAVLAAALADRLARHGVPVLVASSAALRQDEPAYIETCLRHGAHGLVLVSGLHADPRLDHSEYHRLAERGIALVLINGHVKGLRVPTVQTDEAAAAGLAVEHLCGLGHQRIGLANGEPYLHPSANRLAGFRRAMTRLGGYEERLTIATRYTVTGGYKAAESLVAAGATAIVAGSDLMAIGAIRAVRELGRRVPADVSVVGYDDSYLAALTDPPLTTVHQPLDRIGAVAAEAMWQQLQGQRPARLRHVLPPTLVVRGSTGPVPGRAA
jgi:DNA-binding LacI/PurR family transcriptional regulator